MFIFVYWPIYYSNDFHFVRSSYRSNEVPVYNLTQSDMNPMKWGEVVEKGKIIAHEYPFEMTLWYPGGNIRSNKFMHNIIVLLFHWIPAYFIDFIMLIVGQKRLYVLQPIHVLGTRAFQKLCGKIFYMHITAWFGYNRKYTTV